MLSSTLMLGLFFVLFVDTFARPSRGNPVISYAQHLQNFGLSGVRFKSPESKHDASDSPNPFSWPIDNVKRTLDSTGMRNRSSLDALRLALMDNSSNPVETTKSTLVVNETDNPKCYGIRRVAPIANPANCNMAIYELISGGDPDEAVLWSGRQTWSWETCKVELVPRADYAEFLTRGDLAQAAWLIMRNCVTRAHGYRGGRVAVGLPMIFNLKVWASTSSGTANETTSAFQSLLDSPDLSEQEQIQR